MHSQTSTIHPPRPLPLSSLWMHPSTSRTTSSVSLDGTRAVPDPALPRLLIPLNRCQDFVEEEEYIFSSRCDDARLQQMRFGTDTCGIPMSELLGSPERELREKIPDFDDQTILEIGRRYIKIKIYVRTRSHVSLSSCSVY